MESWDDVCLTQLHYFLLEEWALSMSIPQVEYMAWSYMQGWPDMCYLMVVVIVIIISFRRFLTSMVHSLTWSCTGVMRDGKVTSLTINYPSFALRNTPDPAFHKESTSAASEKIRFSHVMGHVDWDSHANNGVTYHRQGIFLCFFLNFGGCVWIGKC